VTTDPVAAQGFPGQVLGEQKVTEGVGGFAGPLDSADVFGTALANIGDVNGDGVTDLAVGAWNRDSGCCSEGAAYVLFLNPDGTVDDHAELSDDTPVLGATIDAFDNFGTSMAPLGDFDGNGVPDLVVGGKGDEGLAGGFSQGAVWLVLLETDGGVKGVTQIGDGLGGFTGLLDNNDMFGSSVANLGDLDGNGVVDLAVGAPRDDDGGSERGSVWILFLDADGTVASHAKISDTSGGFTGGLADGDWFGSSVAALGDLDDDGVTELAVGAPFDGAEGSVWILFLDDDGTVKSQSNITEGSGGFGGPLSNGDSFGWSLEAADLDGDRLVDLAVGAPGDDAGGLDPFGNRGAVWLLFLDDSGGVTSQRRISSTSPDFVGPLSDDDQFGDALAFLGDLDDDGVLDLAVGAHEDDTSGANEGAVWNLFLNAARWIDQGQGLAGTSGTPVQDGFGKLMPGSDITITMDGALRSTTAYLVVGFAELSAPFKGGVMVPDPGPPSLVIALPTGAGGGYALADTWPAGIPSGFTLWMQTWVADPGGPLGYAATNALSMQTP
jgi:hypothetical protein